MQHRSVRQHLFRVLLIGVLPVGLFAAAMLYLHWREQENERVRLQMETTRLMGATIDNALDSTVQRLTMLAELWGNGTVTTEELHHHAIAALRASPDWETVVMLDDRGRGVMRTEVPFGTPLPTMRLHGYSARALREGRATVSDIFVSSVRKEKVAGVAVPVSRSGRTSHVLAAGLELGWYDALLRRQGLPPGGIVGVFDSQLRFVARSHDGEARRGTDAAPGLEQDMRRAPEGIGRYASLDGNAVYTSWTRTRHGWWVAMAVPAAPIDGALRTYLLVFGGLWLLLVGAGLAFATVTGRRITNQVLGQLDAARAERDRLLHKEREARRAAEAANRAKDEFLAMLGHELRNPLAAISNAIAVIRNPRRTPDQLEFASAVITRQSKHLKRLIDDLLDVGRVMTGKIPLQRQPLDLQSSLDAVVSTLQTAGTLSRHRVSVEAVPVTISGDPTRIEQVISNLLVNAATYTPEGRDIRVSLRQDAGDAVLAVADDGVGIPAESLPRLFELFYQGEAPSHRPSGGLGIGLTLVKRLVELHGGTIQAASEGLGRGATFTVRFPATAKAVYPLGKASDAR